MRVGGAHDAHLQHVRKSNIRRELAAPCHQRRVLETSHRTTDNAHLKPRSGAPAARSAAWMRCGVAGNSSIETPNGDSASLIALRTAAGAPIAPPSPNPFALVTDAPVGVSRWWTSIGGISRAVGGR